MTTVDVVIPWRGDGSKHRAENMAWVCARYAKLHPEWRLIFGDSDPDKEFCIGAALNNAIAKATADVVVLAGADSVMSSTSIRLAAIHAETHPWVMASDAYVRLDREQTEAVWDMDPGTSAVPITGGGAKRSLCQLGWGTLALRREQFDKVWYDERLTAAWEDSQFGASAALLLGDPFRMTQTTTVLLWHPPAHRAHHPDFPNGSDLYAMYRNAHYGQARNTMAELLREGGPSWVKV